MAVLDGNPVKGEPNILVLRSIGFTGKPEEGIIAHLTHGLNPMSELDLTICGKLGATLTLSEGSGPVTISGNLMLVPKCPRPQSRSGLPLSLFLQRCLPWGPSFEEVETIVKRRLIKVDGKVCTDAYHATGFMDVVSITRVDDHYRILFDAQRHTFRTLRIKQEEAQYKLCRVQQTGINQMNIPWLTTHDGRTFHNPARPVKVNDTVMVEFSTDKIKKFIQFKEGNLIMISGGHNLGRVGRITRIATHPQNFDVVEFEDALGNTFLSRVSNAFVIGKETPLIKLPRAAGFRLTAD